MLNVKSMWGFTFLIVLIIMLYSGLHGGFGWSVRESIG